MSEYFGSGRQGALLDWLFKKELSATQKLLRKYYNAKRDRTPERRAKKAKVRKAWGEKNLAREQARLAAYAKTERRKAKVRENARRYRERKRVELTTRT